MTDRQRQKIESYLPHSRDESLEPFEYYYQRDDGKIFKVYISEICPLENGTGYRCRYSHNGNLVHTFGEYSTIRKRQLYDNKKDCADCSHLMFDNWEQLRELQNGESGA
jgi:hypothetical protein